ncbi:MAG: methyltransferase domain-containing protein [Desulfosoma sp.]
MSQSTRNTKGYVQQAYRRLYQEGVDPDLPIVQGKDLACHLGYDLRLVHRFPYALWARFFPCGHLLPWISVKHLEGSKILNLGSGVGMDTFFLAFGRAGDGSFLVNVDVVEEALVQGKAFMDCEQALHGPGKASIFWVRADAEAVPFGNEVFDVVLMNGVFNLFEQKDVLLQEVFRVLKRSGNFLMADLVRTGPLPAQWGSTPEGWLWCVNGALDEQELSRMLQNAGLVDVQILSKDCELEPLWREIIRARKPS